MSFAKVLIKDFCILRGCITQKIISRTKIGKENVFSDSRILLRNLCDESRLTIPKPISSNKVLTRLRQKDRIPHGFIIIYRAQRSFSFSFTHCCILLTAFTIPAFSLILSVKNNFKLPLKISDQIIIKNWLDIIIFVFLAFCVVISTLKLVSRFPFRIYHNKNTNEYIATYSHILLPWKTTNVTFKKGQVSIIPQEEKWMLQISNYKINGNKVIFIEEHFERPSDLEGMIGKMARVKREYYEDET